MMRSSSRCHTSAGSKWVSRRMAREASSTRAPDTTCSTRWPTLRGCKSKGYSPRPTCLYRASRCIRLSLMHLLALYKQVGRGEYPFDLQPLSVGHLVEQVVSGARVLLASRAIRLDTHFDPALVWHLDEDLIIGVLGHALNNAVNYTQDRIRLAISLVDGQLELRVEDNGAGYPEAMLAAGAPSGLDAGAINFRTNSTGLGLYFSRQVAQMHKHRERRGAVRLENGGSLGGGCFILTLP